MGGWDGGMFADPMTLQPGEAEQVARRLREVLTHPLTGRTTVTNRTLLQPRRVSPPLV